MAVEFTPGSIHTAHVTLDNPKDVDIDYVGELRLVIGNTVYASSGPVTFSIPARGSKDVDFPITMPDSIGTYTPYLYVFISDVLANVFVSESDVQVKFLIPEITDTRITLQSIPSWGYDTLAQDLIAGAELSVDFRISITRAPNLETYLFEFCLIQDSTIIPIGSSTTKMWDIYERWISFVPRFLVALPAKAGIYDTMLRIYRGGNLAAQYPYLGTIEVLPRGVSNFNYTKPTARFYWNPDYPAYFVNTSCTITNLGSGQESRKVVLWVLCEYEDTDILTGSYFHHWERQWKCLRGESGGEVIVTLKPGQTYNYSYNNRGRISGGMIGSVQLRDEDGKVSPQSDKKEVTK